MVQRIAGCLALIAFAVCLLEGGIEADNPFTTTIERALVAMFTTLLIGMIVGTMAKAMLDENLRMEKEKLKKIAAKSPGSDR